MLSVAEYLFRVSVRAVRLLRSRSWPVAVGTVLSADCPPASYGCTVAYVHYEYPAAGGKHAAVYETPFISPNSGEDFAAKFVKTMGIKVRVKPGDPLTSVPCDWAS